MMIAAKAQKEKSGLECEESVTESRRDGVCPGIMIGRVAIYRDLVRLQLRGRAVGPDSIWTYQIVESHDKS
jgi:hypothetical protein